MLLTTFVASMHVHTCVDDAMHTLYAHWSIDIDRSVKFLGRRGIEVDTFCRFKSITSHAAQELAMQQVHQIFASIQNEWQHMQQHWGSLNH